MKVLYAREYFHFVPAQILTTPTDLFRSLERQIKLIGIYVLPQKFCSTDFKPIKLLIIRTGYLMK